MMRLDIGEDLDGRGDAGGWGHVLCVTARSDNSGSRG